MKGLYCCILFFFASITISSGQTTGDFRSFQTGDWNNVNTWERFDGLVWVNPAPSTPTNADGVITITHTVTVPNTFTVTIDQVSVALGGTLTIAAGGTVTVSDGTGNDLDVYNDGFDYGFLTVNGTLINDNNATITGTDGTNANFNSGGVYRHLYTTAEGSIPNASWNINSTVEIQGYTGSITATAGGNWGQNFGNFVFSCTNLGTGIMQFAGLLTSIQNDLTVSSTGASGSFRFSSTENPTISIGRDLTISGTSRVLFGSGTATTMTVNRDFIFTSTNLTGTNFATTGATTINVTRDFSMNATGGRLNFASSGSGTMNVTGNFTLTAGSIFFGSAGSATGTLNITGNFSNAGLLDENSSSTTAGNINFTGSSVHTFINSGSINNTINFSIASLSTLDLGTSFITGTGSFTLNGTVRLGATDAGGALQTGSTGGNLRVTGTRTYASNSTIVYNGTAGQFIGNGFPSSGVVNLTIDNSSNVTLSNNLDIVALSVLTLTSGNIVIGTQTLTVNGTVSGSGGIVGGSSSNMVIGGTGNFGTLTFSGTNELFNFTLNRTSSGLVTLGDNLTILGTFTHTAGTLAVGSNTFTISGDYGPATPGELSVTSSSTIVIDGPITGTLPSDMAFAGTGFGTLTLNRASATLATTSSITITNLNLTSGSFSNGTGITMATGGTITRSGGTMSTSPNNTTNAYNVVYTSGTLTTGLELPSNTTALANLSKTGTGTVTLGAAVTINGILTLSSGSFDAGTNTIDLKGNFVSDAASTLTSSPITFSGTTIISGNSTPTFGNITVSGALTPSSSFQINGNLVNNGTLNAGSATTIFGGVTTISGTSICSFSNITISGTLNAPTGNFNVAGNWTNNGIFNRGVTGNTVTFNGVSSILGSASTSFSGLIISGTLNSPATLNVAGDFTNNGSFNAGTGTLVLNGSTAQSIGGSTTTNFNNITISKSSGTATVLTNQNITNTLTLTSGALNANGRITLISTASGDARIAEITGGASITGNIIAQRYLPNTNAGNVYRYLASPATNGFVSEWKDDFPITGTFTDPSTQEEWPGLLVTSTARNMFWYNEAHTPTSTMEDRYESYPPAGTASTAASLVNGRGYSARVRQTSPITIDVTGAPRQGDAPVSVTAQSAGGNDGWNLIGNPYPAPINWENVTRPAGVNAQIALKDNTNNIGLGAGQYVYYTQGGSGIPASYTGTIASGQAFWVRATSNATITFQENDKQAISNPDFIRQGSLEDIVRVNISGNSHQDEIVIRFADNASDGSDSNYDAFKLTNDFINLSSMSADSLKMAINVLSGLNCNKEVGLVVDGVTPGSYAFTFTQFESFREDVTVKLLDNLTGVTFDLTEGDPIYDFNVTSDEKTFGSKRFRLFFTFPSVEADLNVRSDDVCLGSDARITIENSQNGIKYYSTINGNTVSDQVISEGGNVELIIPQDKLAAGENIVVLMASIAGCGSVPLNNTVVVKTDNIYEITGVNSGKNCGEGHITISAQGAPANGSYRWYEDVADITPIEGQTGADFITPTLNKTKTYFVSIVNSLGCEGAREAVVAEVVQFEDAAISVLDNGVLSSNYAENNQWYYNDTLIPDATNQEIIPDKSGIYKIEVNISGCTTSAEYEFSVTGIEENFRKTIHVYPNPVEDKVSIELKDKAPANAIILNTVGKPIGSIQFAIEGNHQKGEFNLGSEAAGLYLIKIVQGKKVINYKIIKK